MSVRHRAFITGISGQDGTYLAELLFRHGWEVFGICRSEPSPRVTAVASVRTLDVCDQPALTALLRDVRPDHCYHLAAYHRSSQAQAVGAAARLTAELDEEGQYLRNNLLAAHGLLAAVLTSHPTCRVFLAGSSHMFGSPVECPQTELTPFRPNSLYGVTKLAAMHLGQIYRAKHGVFCCTGILYNHESPLRGDAFISTRIAKAAAEIARSRRGELVVGALDACVDWGFAGDYVDAMRRMLEADTPDDYIIATGILHTVGDFVRLAFECVDHDWSRYVREEPDAHRPVATGVYCGDPSRIRAQLGWRPATSFEALVQQLVDHHRRPSEASP